MVPLQSEGEDQSTSGRCSPKETSLLTWYMNTPACIQAYTAKAPELAAAAPVQGLW